MKKFLSILLCISILACVFVACSKEAEEETTTEAAVSTTKGITTDDAKITEADAINLMKSYSAKELGLSKKEYEECSFMVASSGVKVEDSYYVKVIATIKTEHDGEDGNKTYTFDNKGEYYIRYDGKQILQKDMKAEEEKYNEMEVREVPTTTIIVDEAHKDAQ